MTTTLDNDVELYDSSGSTEKLLLDLTRQISDLVNRVDRIEQGDVTDQLGHSSVEDGSLVFYDEFGNERTRIGKQDDATFVGGVARNNTIPPPVPRAPIVDPVLSGLKITSSGTSSGGGWTRDFSHINVYRRVGSSGTFTKIGSLAPDPSVWIDAPLLYVEHQYYLTSVNTSGYESSASALGSGTPLQAVGQDILDGIVTAVKLAEGSVEASKIAVGAIGTAQIGTGVVSLANLANGSVDATKLLPNAVTSGAIAPSAVTTTQLAANSVVAGKIAAGNIGALHIAAKAIQAGALDVDAVQAGTIAASAVTAREVKALSLTGDQLAVNTIKAGNIEAGAVTASKLQADMVLATRVICGNPIAARSEMHPVSGIQLYNSAGIRKTHLNAADGSALITGQIRSADAGSRVIMNPDSSNPDEMRFFPSSGSNYGYLTSRTISSQAGIAARASSTRGDTRAGEVSSYPATAYLQWCGEQGSGNENPNSLFQASESYAAMGGVEIGIVALQAFGGPPNRASIFSRNSSGVDISDSVLEHYRRSSGGAVIKSPANNAGILFGGSAINIVTNSDTTFGPIYASGFLIGCSGDVKEDIGDPLESEDLVQSLVLAKPRFFRYKDDKKRRQPLEPIRRELQDTYKTAEYGFIQPDYSGTDPADSPQWHFTPLWEEMPQRIRHTMPDGSKVVSAHDLAGWALHVCRELVLEVRDLKKKVKDLAPKA